MSVFRPAGSQDAHRGSAAVIFIDKKENTMVNFSTSIFITRNFVFIIDILCFKIIVSIPKCAVGDTSIN